MSGSIRSRILYYLYWLGMVYALFLSLHPYLIGCGCADVGPDHTCGIVQYYATIGAALWMVLLPLGLWLYRGQENASIGILILVFVQLLCTMVLLYLPDLPFDAVESFTIRSALTLPLVPYVGLTKLMGGDATDTLLTVLFLYLLLTAAYGVYLYRRERQR